ncbi:iron-containing alcohol dehydrogenase [Fusobacterium sp.]|uniref:iron-containing alcohol dehydrogenase n=1 Tax=Fusobacterium sp. TaxID=68766 RepID=UPI00290348C9|nr:iron-containing alcohol dehydrogenase [Fusobacterium sp.]MDU1909663.1 iron-containing alcohol dehydrogenase [Fusobacterium sp.]
MKSYYLNIPSNVYSGLGSVDYIETILNKEKVSNIIIFTDKGVRENYFFSVIVEKVKNTKVNYNIIDDLATEPSYHDVEKVMKELDKYKSDFIIAVGGGSVMDIAKLCSILKDVPYAVKDLLKDPSQGNKQIKSLMIPTTCGTGSEATCNSIVSVPEEGLKVGIVNNNLIPDYVILDPAMIEKLPKKLIASTGVDALAHCVECLTSKKSNPFSDLYALAGGELIFKNIRKAYLNPDDMEAKTNMLMGAFYGGIAITSSGTTAVHALSYPLGGKYHIPHGISNAIMMVPVMEFNKDACLEQFSRMCDRLRPDMSKNTSEEKVQYIIDEIKDIVKVTEIPVNLKDFGVTINDLDFLVEAGSKVTRLLSNNLKELSLDDIKNIYLKVLN